MIDLEARAQKAIEDISGNESLLEMLDGEAAAEMLDWGKSTATMLVNQTDGLDDAEAEEVLDRRLKAVRQFMRSAGNWAAGKYVDPDDRLQLREKLLGHAKTIFGEGANLPTAEEMDAVLNQMDMQQNTQKQSVQNLKELFNEAR
jgi:MoxR-like ATPase